MEGNLALQARLGRVELDARLGLGGHFGHGGRGAQPQHEGHGGEAIGLVRPNRQHALLGRRAAAEIGQGAKVGPRHARPLDGADIQERTAADGQLPAGECGVADRDHGHAEGVQGGLPHFAAAGEEDLDLLAVLGRLEQADLDGLLVGPGTRYSWSADLPTADVAPGHLFHEVIGRQRKFEGLALRAAEFQRDVQGHAEALLLDVQHPGGLDGQAAIDLPLRHAGTPLQLQGPAGSQGRLQGFVGPLGFMNAAVVGLAQADLGPGLWHAERDGRGRSGGQRSAGPPPSAHVLQFQPHFPFQLVDALAGNLQNQMRRVHGRGGFASGLHRGGA